MLQVCGVGSNGIAPIALIGVLGNHKLKEPPRAVPSGLGIDPGGLVLHHFLKVSKGCARGEGFSFAISSLYRFLATCHFSPSRTREVKELL
jgi:hypothetical protein